jgi:FtsZ-interacting cell division protein ZipA
MGSMSMKGLCLFMELSGNVAIDHERLDIFIQTAKQLAEELHANLLDEHQKPVSEETFAHFDKVVALGEALPA